MKNPTVRLKIRVRLSNGSYPFLDPVTAANGKIRPFYAMVNGKPEHHPEGIYYLRYRKGLKRLWEPVGTDLSMVVAAKQRRETHLAAEAAGLGVRDPAPSTPETSTGSGPSTADAIKTYLRDTKQYKSEKTHVAYQHTLNTFSESCRKSHLNLIDRRDILNYVDFLRARGNGRRTIANRVSYVLIFLRKQGIKVEDVIHPSDRPKYTEKIVKAYNPNQLQILFAAADVEDFVLFHFFLGSGCRDNEVVHACWEDLDFRAKTHDVREKFGMKFEVKDHEERTIPLSDGLIDLLREHRKRHPDGRFMFPGERGKADHHLLRRLKRLALRAGLNCGRCVSKNGQSCKDKPVCDEWELHRFRKTFATMHADAGAKIHTLARWLGHADLETTLTYLAGSLATSERTREQVNGTFDSFVTRSVASARKSTESSPILIGPPRIENHGSSHVSP